MRITLRKADHDPFYSKPHSKAIDFVGDPEVDTECIVLLENDADWEELITGWGILEIVVNLEGGPHFIDVGVK